MLVGRTVQWLLNKSSHLSGGSDLNPANTINIKKVNTCQLLTICTDTKCFHAVNMSTSTNSSDKQEN